MMEKKNVKIWLPLLFSLTMIAGIFLGYRMQGSMPGKSFFYIEKRRPVQEILDLIDKKYVDNENMPALADTAIQAILSKLDPHSSFIPAEELARVNEDINGSFFGIGIEYSILQDSLNVINVLKNGPAEKAGLQTGDIILKANDSLLSGKNISPDKIRNTMRGPLDSKVKLDILRNHKAMQIILQRGIIPLSSVDAAYMMDGGTGYIRLNKFSSLTYREFMDALTGLKGKGMTKLILDLRNNGGGVLDEAVEIADEFLSGDKLITYTEGAHAAKNEYRCRRTGQFEQGELVVLADEGTASASEILIGALQDWDRATVVGRRTFGKGLVQEQFMLSDNSALRLTVARYYTPMGRSIQRPYDKGNLAYFEDYHKRFTNGELIYADSFKNDTTQLFITKGGKKIYGGGGISPDYFVAEDTGKASAVITQFYIKGTLSDFGNRYLLANPSIKTRFSTPAGFIQNFEPDAASWSLLKSLALKDSIKIEQLTDHEKTFIQKLIKSSIARQLFRNEGYFEAINRQDPDVLKAIEIIKAGK